ncbi:hypothetical protein IT418_01665 [bacterium]|nr:hypothetical protein [bacterium]
MYNTSFDVNEARDQQYKFKSTATLLGTTNTLKLDGKMYEELAKMAWMFREKPAIKDMQNEFSRNVSGGFVAKGLLTGLNPTGINEMYVTLSEETERMEQLTLEKIPGNGGFVIFAPVETGVMQLKDAINELIAKTDQGPEKRQAQGEGRDEEPYHGYSM